MEKPVLPVLKVIQEQLALLVPKEQQGQMEQPVLLVLKVIQELLAQLVQ
jgi:hypothetical protein